MKEINRDFIIKLLSSRQHSIDDLMLVITSYINDVEGEKVKLDANALLRIFINNMDIASHIFNCVLDYYSNKFLILKVYDKHGNLIAFK